MKPSAKLSQFSFVVLFVAGIIALSTNMVYWVELSGVDWSYTSSLAWQAVLSTLLVVAALHIVRKFPWWIEEVTDRGSLRIMA